MKVRKVKTTFEFTEEEIKAIKTCDNLFNEIYDAMEEDETFCGCNDRDLDNEVLCFFSKMINEFNENKNRTITCD